MRPSRVVKEFVACVGRGLDSISLQVRFDVPPSPMNFSSSSLRIHFRFTSILPNTSVPDHVDVK